MEENEQSARGLHFVGQKDELIEAKRSFRTIEDRDILIIYHQGVFYAMDSYCYRKCNSSSEKLIVVTAERGNTLGPLTLGFII